MTDLHIIAETQRLILRPFNESDEDLIRQLYMDEEILRYTPFDPMTEEQVHGHLSKMIQDWQANPLLSLELAMILKSDGSKIGRTHILIDPETDTGMIGWFLLKQHWGKGYATETARELLRYSFTELKLHRVNAVCNPENTASWAVLEKYGMRREALLLEKCRYVKRGVASWHDELEYAILRHEWIERNEERKNLI